MAQTFIHNFDKVSPLGYKQPANDPNAASPDYITHAQLRYSPFTSSEAIAGSVVSGANSTFSFSIEDAQIAYTFKMYYSTDGTTYNEDKTFGGADGKKLFGANDLSNYVTLSGAQNITGTKTVTSSANLVIASGSDITVQTGGDITLADAPSASTDAVNKAYVDGLIGYKSCVFWVSSYTPDESTALSYSRIYNNTGVTPTLTYLTTAGGSDYGLRVTFNRTSSASDIILNGPLLWEDGFGARYKAGYFCPIETFVQSSANTSLDLIFVRDDFRLAQTATSRATTFFDTGDFKEYSLSGSTVSEGVWNQSTPPGSNEWVGIDVAYQDLTLRSDHSDNWTLAEALKNFRLELRFYD